MQNSFLQTCFQSPRISGRFSALQYLAGLLKIESTNVRKQQIVFVR